jgi:hypothetical protein
VPAKQRNHPVKLFSTFIMRRMHRSAQLIFIGVVDRLISNKTLRLELHSPLRWFAGTGKLQAGKLSITMPFRGDGLTCLRLHMH